MDKDGNESLPMIMTKRSGWSVVVELVNSLNTNNSIDEIILPNVHEISNIVTLLSAIERRMNAIRNKWLRQLLQFTLIIMYINR